MNFGLKIFSFEWKSLFKKYSGIRGLQQKNIIYNVFHFFDAKNSEFFAKFLADFQLSLK